MLCRRSSSQTIRRRGMVAAFAVVSFTVLLAAAALSLDGGALLTERRHAQETADAAALAAAADLFQHYPINNGVDSGGTAAKSAQTTATANGYTNDGTTSTVTVNIPPTSGKFVGIAGYAEVIVTYNQPPGLSTFFAAASGSGSGSGSGVGSTTGSVSGPGSAPAPVSGRAVARGLWVPAKPQIIVFNLTAGSSLLVTNNAGSVNVLGGPVVVNSNSASAASNTTSATFTAPSYDITGSVVGSFTGPKTLGARPTPDPLSYLPMPTADVTGQTLTVQSSSGVTYDDNHPAPNPLPEGIYQGGITVNGGASLTLQTNGTYVIKGGGFNFNSYGNLTGNGVLIYNQPSALDSYGIQISNNNGPSTDPNNPFGIGPPGTITLKPLTTGPYQGITLFQAQSGTAPFYLFGSGGMNISGNVYAANARVNVRTESYGSNNDVAGTQYMVGQVQFAGLSAYTLSQLPQSSMQRIIGLVE